MIFFCYFDGSRFPPEPAPQKKIQKRMMLGKACQINEILFGMAPATPAVIRVLRGGDLLATSGAGMHARGAAGIQNLLEGTKSNAKSSQAQGFPQQFSARGGSETNSDPPP